MCDQTVSVAVISAIAALGGAAVSQAFSLLQAHLERTHRRRTVLRDKYEELAQCLADTVNEYTGWLAAESNEALLLLGSPQKAQRLHILAQLYFPPLKEKTRVYLAALIQFRNALSSSYNPHMPESVGVQGAKSPLVHAAQQILEQAKDALDTAIEQNAETFTAA